MNRKLCLLLAVAVSFMLVAACASEVRYAPSELNQFSPKVQEHIKKEEIALGMSPTAVRYAWGGPARVNVLEPDDQGNYREEWVYTKVGIFSTKLIFTEGKLTGIISGPTKSSHVFKKKSSSEEEPAEETEKK